MFHPRIEAPHLKTPPPLTPLPLVKTVPTTAVAPSAATSAPASKPFSNLFLGGALAFTVLIMGGALYKGLSDGAIRKAFHPETTPPDDPALIDKTIENCTKRTRNISDKAQRLSLYDGCLAATLKNRDTIELLVDQARNIK